MTLPLQQTIDRVLSAEVFYFKIFIAFLTAKLVYLFM
ncbi:hypothetical protein BRIN106911_08430 [Brevibacillus invocatus]